MSLIIDLEPPRRQLRRKGLKPLMERRFPLHLEPAILTVRTLYEQAKEARWDPERNIAWRIFRAADYTAEQLQAARLSWSRRAWVEYAGFAETPSILIRFCLEHGGESDPKMFLTVRGTEEAWHVDCAYRFAECAGGYLESPTNPDYARLFGLGLFRQAFDPALSPAAYLAAHVAVLDGIDLELHRGYLRHATDPLAASILQRLVQDKERHAAFGWVYLHEQSSRWDDAMRSEIAEEISQIVLAIVFNGLHSPAFAPDGIADEILAADAITRGAGLGAATAEEEVFIVRQYLGEARSRFAEMGIEIGRLEHGRLGEF